MMREHVDVFQVIVLKRSFLVNNAPSSAVFQDLVLYCYTFIERECEIMASVSSLSSSSSSSSSSIYGNRTYNIISGLASGMDTEELISGMVQSYQQKIQSLQNKNTKLQWQQEAIQNISDKLVEFDRNYSSYVYSDTNLMSASFFNNAVKTTTNGTYANLVTASGKTSSTVVLNAVKQLATAARYTVSGSHLSGVTDGVVTGGEMSNLAGMEDFSKLSGSLTLNYGDRTVSIDLGERDLFVKDDGAGHKVFDAKGLQDAIVEQLSKQQISTSSGSVVTADKLINVTVEENGAIGFSDKSTAGNAVSIAGATGNLATMISGLDQVIDAKSNSFRLNSVRADDLVEPKSLAEYLSGKNITVTLDGKSKTITLPQIDPKKYEGISDEAQKKAAVLKDFTSALDTELSKQFGAGRVSVSASDGKLSFQVNQEGSALSVTSSNKDVSDILGIGSGLTSYVDTTKTLEQLSGIDWDKMAAASGVGSAIKKTDADGKEYYVDSAGNRVNEKNQLIDKDGNLMYDLEINGVKIGSYSKTTELNTIINNINSNTEAGVNVSYSKTTSQFVFTAKDTGAGGRIQIDAGGLGSQLFGVSDPSAVPGDDTGLLYPSGSYQAGQDAIISATINGQSMELTRSSNSFDLDGMNITVSGTFNADKDVSSLTENEKVTFTSKTDADTIVDAVKKMVDDLNTIIKEVKSAYSDMPLKKSDNKTGYEPLTDEEKKGMSESAIEAYEEKAKTGILFMDSDLSSLYNDLRNAITSSGADGVTLRSMGIDTAYSDGLTTLTFDEKTFREVLESDPDKVQEAFTKSKENGAATDGLMATIKSITDRYAATTGDVKGILIEKAGSKYSPTAALDNTILDQMKDVEEEISKWQDKMSNQVDYYTNKFTQLEMLINQMNSQSSALSGLLGG